MHLSATRFLAGTFLSAATLFSMPPPDREMVEQYRKDGTLQQKIAFAKSIGNHRVNPHLIQRAQYKLQQMALAKGLIKKGILAEPPPAWKDMPTTGKVKVLTICIDFNDYPHVEAKNSIAQMTDRIFGDGDAEVPAPYESFREYYLRSSYGKLDFGGSVLGWFRPTYDRAAMAETTAGREQLIKEALAKFDADGHDFSQYDNNGDGKIDFFSVIWSGPHGDWASFWWGYQTAFGDDTFKLDGVGFGKYSWQWESRVRTAGLPDTWDGPFSPKTLIHEQGHGLGLPDYYDYDDAVGPRGGVGGYDMMDWVGDHNCFSKWLLDWITPSIVDTNLGAATKTLQAAENTEEALLVMPDATGDKPFSEYFMVQNRQPIGNDASSPIAGDGLVVWHVDSRLDANNWDYLYDNSFTEHKLLRLMEADGLEEIETSAADANAGDFYGPGKEIGPKTLPNTSRYDGTYTNFGVRNITPSAPAMTFDIYTSPADTTAPTGEPTQPVGTSTLDSATFTWTGGTAADPDGELVGYYLQVGSTPGGTDVFDGRVGNVLTRTLSDLGAWDGKSVYARVRAMNAAGLYSAWSPVSAGVAIDLPVFANCADLDNCNLTFKAVGTWAQDTQYYHKGMSSAHGLAADNEQTTLQTVVAGPGKLSFWWKASTEKGFDYYSIMVDGVAQDRISGEVDWSEKALDIPAGSHVISWRWAKDSNTTGALDKVWLDDVQYQKLEPLAITVQPADQTVNDGTSVTFQVAVKGGTEPYAYQWYEGGTAINGATGASYTFVARASDDGKTYKAVVTDSTSTPFQVTSKAAKLTVLGGMVEYQEAEPNNTRYQANAIPRPGVVNGRVDSRRDIDVFKVDLRKGQELDALMTCGLGLRARPQILRMDCVDERGRIVETGHGHDSVALSVKARHHAQTFYVRVYYGRRYEIGDYQLELTF